MEKYVSVSVEERLAAWRALDEEAAAAERAIAAMGQGAAAPGTYDLLLKAKRLREQADREFSAICRAIQHADAADLDTPGSG